VELKKEESGRSGSGFHPFVFQLKLFKDANLNLLFDHIEKSVGSQVRLKWEPGTVVVWDNRISTHVCIFRLVRPIS